VWADLAVKLRYIYFRYNHASAQIIFRNRRKQNQHQRLPDFGTAPNQSLPQTRLRCSYNSAATQKKLGSGAEKTQNIIDIFRNLNGICTNLNGIFKNINDILSFIGASSAFRLQRS